MQKVSIIIPVFNEKDTLRLLLEKVEQANFSGLEKENSNSERKFKEMLKVINRN